MKTKKNRHNQISNRTKSVWFFIRLVFGVFILLTAKNNCSAQSNYVRIAFEVDGKRTNIDGRFSIYFKTTSGDTINPLLFMNGFVVPNISNSDHADLFFKTIGYELIFKSLSLKKMDGLWIFGVDKKPFDKDNLSKGDIESAIKYIYYLDVHPTMGDGTKTVVKVKK